jgi:hypothetical protein
MKRMVVAAAAVLSSMLFVTTVQAQSEMKKRGFSRGSARTVAPEGVGDVYKVVYRVSGTLERDFNVGPSTANNSSTAFICSNFSATSEKIYFLTRDWNWSIAGSVEFTISSNRTAVALTRAAESIEADLTIIPSGFAVLGGSTVIMSTTTNLHCSALILDRSLPTMNGVALHMVRFNALGGTME